LISIIKLVDGTEVLGEIINDDEISLIVKEPLKVILSYARPGGFPIITMHRYSFFDDCERVIFKKAHVVTYNQVKKGVDLYYINSLKNQKEFVDKAFNDSLASITSELMDDANSDNQLYRALFEHGVSSSKH
jgi:hypothetical protein